MLSQQALMNLNTRLKALFITCQKNAVLWNALVDLGYEQGPTLVICDSKCASGIAADSVTQRRSKAYYGYAFPLDA